MEYALVVVAMLSVVVAVGAIANVLERGVFVEHALASAAYHVTASVGWIADVCGGWGGADDASFLHGAHAA